MAQQPFSRVQISELSRSAETPNCSTSEFAINQITVRGSKGVMDKVTMLPQTLQKAPCWST